MGHFGAFRGVGVSVGVSKSTYLYKSPAESISEVTYATNAQSAREVRFRHIWRVCTA